jgi:hypothetical protein
MVSVVYQALLAGLLLILVSGCSQKPTLNEAELYLQVKTTQAEFNSYNTQLRIAEKQMAEVIPELREVAPTPPQSRVGQLATFLETNNCLKPDLTDTERVGCYRLTRVVLIQSTEKLDGIEMELWVAKKTVQRLSENIKTIVENAPKMSNSDTKPP